MLILLPILLSSLYITVGAIGIAAADGVPGDSAIMGPSVATHSEGPNPGHGLTVDSFFDITYRIDNVGPLAEDVDGWNLAGRLDPAFFRILAVQNGAFLNQECSDMGGADLYRSSVNLATGEWAASELCVAGLPHPEDAGATGGGALAVVQVRVLQIGCSLLDLDTANSFEETSTTSTAWVYQPQSPTACSATLQTSALTLADKQQPCRPGS